MAEAAPPRPAAASGTLPCATCRQPVDPLRAARVAHVGGRFRYFCSSECRDRYALDPSRTPLPLPRRSRPSPTPERVLETGFHVDARRRTAEAIEDVASDGVQRLSSRRFAEEPAPALGPDAAPPTAGLLEGVGPSDVGTLLLAISGVGALLSAALALAGDTPSALGARLVLVVVATVSLVAHALSPGRDPSEPRPTALLLGSVLTAAAAVAARATASPETSSITSLAGLVLAAAAGSAWIIERARRPLDAERDRIQLALDGAGHRVSGEEVVEAHARDLRPGEEIVVEAGERVPVDATIVAGTARIHPWLDATSIVEVGEGDTLVAGARVIEGRLRAIVAWAAGDRAWMRLTGDALRRADIHAPLARLGRHLTERGAPIVAGLAALGAFSSNREIVEIVAFAGAAHLSLAHATVALVAGAHSSRAVLRALARGIAFRTAAALDRAGKVSSAVFCARGTLLVGEPEVTSIEALAGHEPPEVIALLAGAESSASHPTAMAILRAARSRGIRPDGVRSPTPHPGLGVTAVAGNGEPLVVGTRALMLQQRISVASAEGTITRLEAEGRSVLLVGLAGRLIGVVGLQDGLRPGARAAIQHLLDVGIEPILLSGDTREACEALGRAVDVEHVRAEVLPHERGEEIRRLADGGATVAVLGRSPADDVALAAADVSVALAAAGSSSAEWHVQLASSDVRDAAYALRLAHRYRRDAGLSLAVASLPGLTLALTMAAGLAPPGAVPVVTLASAGLASLRLLGRRP
jgi:P-type Cu+ transporter